jgi:hypothetical protein
VGRNRRVVAPVEASTAVQTRHLRLRARSTSEIRITTDGTDMRGASGEVVVRNRVERRVIVAAVCGRSAGLATERIEVVIVGRRLPVDRLETLIELLRAAELPFTEDSPEDEDTTNRCHSGDEDGKDVALLLGGRSSHGRGIGSLNRDGVSLGRLDSYGHRSRVA